VIPVVLVVGVVVCFSPAFSGELLTWDDQANFVDNTAWQGVGWTNLKWMATAFHMGHYQPLTWLSFGIQHAVGASGAAAMHGVNVLLHALNAVLFFYLCRALLRAGFGAGVNERQLALAAGLAAGLFALHPLRAESVAWVTERRDVLSTAFLLGAALAYLRSAEVGQVRLRSRGWYAWCVVLLLLSCLCKAWGMSFFLVLLALDLWPLRRLFNKEDTTTKTRSWHVVLEKWPMVLIGVGTAWIASRAQLGTFATKTLEQWTATDRLVQACYGLWFYVMKSVAPTGLSPLYELPERMNPSRYVAVIVFAVVLLGAIVWCWRKCRAVSVGLIIYLVLISPVLGFVQSGEQLVADRYSYLATMPLALLVAAGVLVVARRTAAPDSKAGGLVAALSVMAVVSLGLMTYSQGAVWRSSLSLWEHAAEVTPTSMVLVYEGDSLLNGGNVEEAQKAYGQALGANPKDGRAGFSYAVTMERQGRTGQAERAYLDAIPNLSTRRYQAHLNLGEIYWTRGQRDEALRQFELAMAEVQRPDHKRPSGAPFMRMARAKGEMGDDAGAIAMLQKAAGYADTRAAAEGVLAQVKAAQQQGNK
jgi:hypothetical protein